MTLPRDASYDRRYFIRLTTGPLDGPVIKAQKDSIHAFTKKKNGKIKNVEFWEKLDALNSKLNVSYFGKLP